MHDHTGAQIYTAHRHALVIDRHVFGIDQTFDFVGCLPRLPREHPNERGKFKNMFNLSVWERDLHLSVHAHVRGGTTLHHAYALLVITFVRWVVSTSVAKIG